MEEKKRRFPLSILEIISAIILLPITTYFLIRFLCEPLNKHAPTWFFSFWGVILILGFDSVCFVLMKVWSQKVLRIKIYISMIIFVVSLAILICWAVLNLLSGAGN